MIIRCKTCKKETDILCPELWVYKKFIGHGLAWFYSWGCLRAYEKETKERKEAEKMQKKTVLTDEQKEKAVDIALKGGNPLKYLKECGCKNQTTSWRSVRNWAAGLDWDTDVMESLPETFKTPAEEKVELVYDESIAEEYRREQEQKKAAEEAKAAEKVTDEERAREEALRDMMIPEEDFWTFTAISNTELGEFYYDRKYKTIDWRHPDGEEISLPPETWAKLARKIPMILNTLDAKG